MNGKKQTVLDAVPFWIALALPLLVVWAAVSGGWVILAVPFFSWFAMSLLDAALGRTDINLDPNTPNSALFWYNIVLWLWAPIQLATQFGVLIYVASTTHLSVIEIFGVFFGVGILAGTVGIVYAHELMHRPSRWERALADLLMASVLYGHFRTEHLLVHHRHVGTPRDAVTARYNEGFHRFFFRVVPACFRSAWAAEAAQCARLGRPKWHWTNPFWKYGVLQAAFALAALAIGGWLGLVAFAFQAPVAIWQLELVNYVEHYGLTRKYLGDGKYEPTGPHHSWNTTYSATNWLLINLQRHSDHHAKPARPFPLLQARDGENVPQLPRGYPIMTTAAMIPPIWRRVMNPRVRKWRAQFYPEIADWGPYNRAEVPVRNSLTPVEHDLTA